jgi:hypothetical protein
LLYLGLFKRSAAAVPEGNVILPDNPPPYAAQREYYHCVGEGHAAACVGEFPPRNPHAPFGVSPGEEDANPKGAAWYYGYWAAVKGGSAPGRYFDSRGHSIRVGDRVRWLGEEYTIAGFGRGLGQGGCAALYFRESPRHQGTPDELSVDLIPARRPSPEEAVKGDPAQPWSTPPGGPWEESVRTALLNLKEAGARFQGVASLDGRPDDFLVSAPLYLLRALERAIEGGRPAEEPPPNA